MSSFFPLAFSVQKDLHRADGICHFFLVVSRQCIKPYFCLLGFFVFSHVFILSAFVFFLYLSLIVDLVTEMSLLSPFPRRLHVFDRVSSSSPGFHPLDPMGLLREVSFFPGILVVHRDWPSVEGCVFFLECRFRAYLPAIHCEPLVFLRNDFLSPRLYYAPYPETRTRRSIRLFPLIRREDPSRLSLSPLNPERPNQFTLRGHIV